MIKKLSSVIAAITLLIVTANTASAVGGCMAYWTPNPPFFTGGGTVAVYSPGGGPNYTVNASNINNWGHYPVDTTSTVLVLRPADPGSCGRIVWGFWSFCVCTTQGGYDCGNPSQLILADGTDSAAYGCVMDCHCPTGGSSGSLVMTSSNPCHNSGQ